MLSNSRSMQYCTYRLHAYILARVGHCTYAVRTGVLVFILGIVHWIMERHSLLDLESLMDCQLGPTVYKHSEPPISAEMNLPIKYLESLISAENDFCQ